MTPSDAWNTRPILTHVRDFARARRVGPTAMLGSLLLRAIAATDPNLVLPAIVGDVASLNMCLALVGPSGHGKGATESAARAATNIYEVDEYPIGSGEGLARTFATNADGEQSTRRAIFTASEVDGLAAIGARSGSTIMATIRQLYSGESIGAANSQKHTRLIVERHSYRACLSIGVQPEAAEPLLGDQRGTAQRMLWLPVGDPQAPEIKPPEPDRFQIARRELQPTERKVLRLPAEAVRDMEDHQLAKLRGEDVDPLDGHRMLTTAKIAAGFMLLDGRIHAVNVEDWHLAKGLMASSDATRRRIQSVTVEAARRANRARALAAADREDVIANRRVERAAKGVIARLGKQVGPTSRSELRRGLRSDLRPEFDAALALLLDRQQIVETTKGVVHVDSLSHPDNRSSEGVDNLSTWTTQTTKQRTPQ